jgi:hypothetical protein
MTDQRKDLLNDWAPGAILGRPFFAVAVDVASDPEPPRLTYVGPGNPCYGTLQLVRKGETRSLCGLPVGHAYWHVHADAAGRVVCRDCAAIAAELLKLSK